MSAAGSTAASAQAIRPDEASAAAARDSAEDRGRAVGCLATAIAYEAAHEPIEGQQAVAEVVLNRLRHPGFPKTVCGVIFAGADKRTGCQFSFACDGSLIRHMMSANVMTVARMVATGALDGLNPQRVAGATHYHADYVSPYWAPSLIRITKIGAHIFYRGAGTRDQNGVPSPYAPFGEPLIAEVAGASPAQSSAAISPAPHPVAPPVFAPWGLTPVTGPSG